MRSSSREETMVEQPVNLPTAIYLGVFSRAEQRVLLAIFKAIAEGGGRCVATLARLARDSNTSKPNHAQCDRPSCGNRPSRKDRAPLRMRCLASQHLDLRGSTEFCARSHDDSEGAPPYFSDRGPRALDQARYAAVREPKAPPGGTRLSGLR